MADTTTTTDEQVQTGAEALPAEQVQDVAVQTTATTDGVQKAESAEGQPLTAEPTSEAKGGERPKPADEDKLRSFAKGQGIEDISELSERERSLLKSAYDNKAAADRNFQRSSELEKATNITQEDIPVDATPQQVDDARIRNMELKMDIQNWKFRNSDKLALESEMVKVLADPTKKALVQGGYLTLDEVYNLAKANAPDNSDAIRTEGKRDALEALAHNQQAAVPTGKATNSAASPAKKDIKDMSITEIEAQYGFAEP